MFGEKFECIGQEQLVIDREQLTVSQQQVTMSRNDYTQAGNNSNVSGAIQNGLWAIQMPGDVAGSRCPFVTHKNSLLVQKLNARVSRFIVFAYGESSHRFAIAQASIVSVMPSSRCCIHCRFYTEGNLNASAASWTIVGDIQVLVLQNCCARLP